jgi:hypothetical protein
LQWVPRKYVIGAALRGRHDGRCCHDTLVHLRVPSCDDFRCWRL